jgi:hypothetical protein
VLVVDREYFTEQPFRLGDLPGSGMLSRLVQFLVDLGNGETSAGNKPCA